MLAENVKSIDAGQHREACEAALAEKSPNRPKAHLTTGEGRLDALCDADSLRHIFIEIEFDGAVGDRVEVIADGGIRRGTDVLKALALGARAVMIGRPVLWGLAVDGAAGAQRVLEILLEELDLALALAGAPVAAELNRSFVAPAPWVTG